jgi:cardiolipin synthase
MFDDAGSIFTTSRQFVSRFKEDRIEYRIFNPLHRYVDKLYLNYRNHQKIAVIDGNIAYTGGINIGDEYANLYEKHGHWKDTAIRIEGEGAWGLTRIFLQMWEFSGKGKPAGGFGIYHPRIKATGEGFVQPFADGPSNNPRNPAETIYRQIIANARDYVYVTTPYLILDEELIKTLVTAAQSGVDVRIVTPRVFDHWYTKYATHSYYESLLAEGVRIFEYTPGFMHAKMILSDGSNAVVGSINLDYRSLFLHYECGVWICGMPAVKEIEQDMRKTFDQSYEITLEEWKRRPWHHKVREMIMRIFAPII